MPADPDRLELESRLAPWTRALLEILTVQERVAFVLREGGLTFDEIGADLDVSLERARQVVVSATDKMVTAAGRGALLHLRVPPICSHDPSVCYNRAVPSELRGALDLSVDVLGLDRKAMRAIESGGMQYLGQLVGRSESQLLGIWNLGRKTLRRIKDALAALGLHLGMEVGDWHPPAAAALGEPEPVA